MSTAKLVVLAMLWTVTAWRLPSAVRVPKQRALWTAFAALTLASTVGVPGVGSRIDASSGVHNLAVLFKNQIGIVACAAVLSFVAGMARPDLAPRVRKPHLAVGLAVLAALTTAFAQVRQPTEVADFYQAYRASVPADAYALVFNGYLGASMAVAGWLFWTYARRAGAGWLRTGLRVLGAGTAVGVCYASLRCCEVVLHLCGRALFVGQSVLDGVELTAITLILVGNAIPAVGVAWHGLRDWRTARRIRGLWVSLTGAVPDVVLTASLGHGPRVRLHRLVIEIRDAALVLAPHASAQVRERARRCAERSGLHGDELAVAAEAYWLRAAREARLAGRTPEGRTPEGRTAESGPVPTVGSSFAELDFASETRRLLRLAEAYRSTAAEAFARSTATDTTDVTDHDLTDHELQDIP
ncbi:MAB_1171c family putative transporter [Kitasatospora mediocidica]|uniref:MAB_1171c family putative transporter n=1 Tax=Kitasatospora mediocidica TaxID=58352 RepID=UPI0007C6340E|nr:MAB_1171c family putative transporter [Kitasatospora mediocidica]